MGNGCGGENGFKFTIVRDIVKKLKFLDPKKVDSLYFDIETLCCDPHDDDFSNGGGIKDFLRANYLFTLRLLGLLHWTTITGRLLVFIIVFTGLSTIGIKYFNWTNFWEK